MIPSDFRKCRCAVCKAKFEASSKRLRQRAALSEWAIERERLANSRP